MRLPVGLCGLAVALLALPALAVPDASPDAAADLAASLAQEPAAAPTGRARPPPRQVPERWTIPPEVIEAVRAVKAAPLGVRMEAASHAFLGLPYSDDADGEGDVPDPDPPSRYDRFDCLTFVEETLGLALAGDPLDAPAIRDALRYKGAPAYASRRHFMEAEWIPDAIANGLLVNVTPSLGAARWLDKVVTADTWKRYPRRRSLFGSLTDAELPVGPWRMPYLDLEEAARVASRIPAGAILVTMRVPRDNVPWVVTHVSTVVELPSGELRMRHASRMGAKEIRDDRVDWYVRHLAEYTRWPSLGVSVLMPVEQGPRSSLVQLR